MTAYDAVVVGAGNGGLAASVTLADQGLRVLLLERHNIPGGCATSFCRGRFEFEVALHQLSGMGSPEAPGPLRMALGKLGVLDALEFVEMEDLYRVVIPDRLDITLKADRNAVVADLKNQFPKEKQGIENFFDLIYGFAMEMYGGMRDPAFSRDKYPLIHRYALKSAAEVIDEFFTDPLLKAVPGAYWGYIGLTPNRLPFPYLAMLYFSYIELKPLHIRGGSQAMSQALASRFESLGGTIRYNCGAQKIIVENGAVRGVTTEAGDTVATGFVVSNASKISTYTEMIDPETVPESVFAGFKGRTVSPSAMVVYLGLDCSAQDLGIETSTSFLLPDTDLGDRCFHRTRGLDMEKDLLAVSCYNIADPEFSPPGTCQVSLVSLKYAAPWLTVPPEQYAAEKFKCAKTMLKNCEAIYPGLGEHIEEAEVATPLTFMRYLGHPFGSIYGFEQYRKDSLFFEPPRTSPIHGLYFAGGWAGDCGFEPTIKSGIGAGRAVLRNFEQTGES